MCCVLRCVLELECQWINSKGVDLFSDFAPKENQFSSLPSQKSHVQIFPCQSHDHIDQPIDDLCPTAYTVKPKWQVHNRDDFVWRSSSLGVRITVDYVRIASKLNHRQCDVARPADSGKVWRVNFYWCRCRWRRRHVVVWPYFCSHFSITNRQMSTWLVEARCSDVAMLLFIKTD